jgi:hypothetical protein
VVDVGCKIQEQKSEAADSARVDNRKRRVNRSVVTSEGIGNRGTGDDRRAKLG